MDKEVEIMNYRIQDFIRYIIPGLYVVALASGWFLLFRDYSFDTEKISHLSGIIIVLIPFVGFVVGFFIESLMAFIEHLFYIIGGRRPSKTILIGSIKMYSVAEKDRILKKHNIENASNLTNKNAGEILLHAKQVINREAVEPFRDNSILSRNIFGSQLVSTISYALIDDNFYTSCLLYAFIAISVLFGLYWFHQNHVYVKYVFAEYAKTIRN